MVHHTKNKGDLAAIKTMADLTEKGFDILTPTVSEHLRFDFVGYKNERFFKFQSKYLGENNKELPRYTHWSDKNGSHKNEYNDSDFDYYAAYIPEKNIICYPSIKFKGCRLTTKIPNCGTKFYWYEDFLDLTDKAEKKSYKDFGVIITRPSRPNPEYRKVERPSKEELKVLIWEKPMMELSKIFGVSDVAIAKWIKSYDIEKPPRGYWLKK